MYLKSTHKLHGYRNPSYKLLHISTINNRHMKENMYNKPYQWGFEKGNHLLTETIGLGRTEND